MSTQHHIVQVAVTLTVHKCCDCCDVRAASHCVGSGNTDGSQVLHRGIELSETGRIELEYLTESTATVHGGTSDT